jgi:DNA end-binding protein Ku
MSRLSQTPDTSVHAPPTAAGSAMAPASRASWSGLLRLRLVTVPVKAYPAVISAPELQRHQFHAGCGQRVRYEKHCSIHGKLEAGAIVTGYEDAPGHCIVLDEEELERLRPSSERALSLERFLDPEQLDPTLFSGRTLYLLPDGLAARHPYLVLAQMFQERKKWALGRVVLAGHRALVLVRPTQNHLLAVHVLHHPDRLRSWAGLQSNGSDEAILEEERQMAGLLIDAASQPFAWSDYRDDEAHKLKLLLEAKRHRRLLESPAQEEELPILHLLEALKRSVAQAQQGPAAPSASSASPKEPKSRKRAPRRSA